MRFLPNMEWGHTLLGAILLVAVLPICYLSVRFLPTLTAAAFNAWLFQVGWWASRELRDYGMKAGLNPHNWRHVVLTFRFWLWSKRDFWLPTGILALVPLWVGLFRA